MLLSEGSGVGGVESVVRCLQEGFHAIGCETRSILFDLRRHFAPEDAGARRYADTEYLNSAGQTLALPQVVRSSQIVRSYDPHIVIAMKTLPMALAPWIGVRGLLLGCEHLGVRWTGTGWRSRIRGLARKISFPRLDGVAALTSAAAAELSELGVRSIACLDNPIPDSLYVDRPALTDLVRRRRRVVVVGRMIEGKGIPDILRAWAVLEKEVSDWSLEFIGSGPLLQGAMDFALSQGLQNVRFLGPTSEIKEVLVTASLLVTASKYEVQPMAVREAMAAGLPVVTTVSCQFIDSEVRAAEAAFLCETDQTEELITKLRLAICEEGERARRAQNAWALAQSWRAPTVAARWLSWAMSLGLGAVES